MSTEHRVYSSDAPAARIMAWLRDREMAHGVTYYHRDAWRSRKEDMCDDAWFTFTAEGRLNHALNYGDAPGDAMFLRDFAAMLDSMGVYYEIGYAWSFHFYHA